MSQPVISVENLSKSYRLGQINTGTLSNDLKVWWAKARGKPNPLLKIGQEGRAHRAGEVIWALKDVGFSVERGEVLGIIGRNGAGKSTLLKILSEVTAPTSGQVKLKGRVASLLEVGTGFHRELTGRENIFLNGAILGMNKAEIRSKFDEIVDFSGIETYIDTPVKRYSSGMYVRLAFAVAAHLEPEILLVDEVLAVGDAEFQAKCLGKMSDVATEGRTVLFVSHNMPAVARLCRTGILLEAGRIKQAGEMNQIISRYLLSDKGSMAERCWKSPQDAPGDQFARLKAVRVISGGGIADKVDIRNPVRIEMEYLNLRPNANLMAAMAFFDGQGTLLFISADIPESRSSGLRPVGLYKSSCEIPGNLFAEGIIRVLAEVWTNAPVRQRHFREMDVVSFNVVDTCAPGSVRAGWGGSLPGVMRPMMPWKVERMADAAWNG